MRHFERASGREIERTNEETENHACHHANKPQNKRHTKREERRWASIKFVNKQNRSTEFRCVTSLKTATTEENNLLLFFAYMIIYYTVWQSSKNLNCSIKTMRMYCVWICVRSCVRLLCNKLCNLLLENSQSNHRLKINESLEVEEKPKLLIYLWQNGNDSR